MHIITHLYALQRASAADIRLLSSAFKIGAKVDGHAADRAVFYLLMTAPDHAMQGVRVSVLLEAKPLTRQLDSNVQRCVRCMKVRAMMP